ncbi:hypothetical protein QF032_000138 [Streptomyces achromogenes]|uniref:Uncharacterized protein n=1 Tax=Streptomyces achromogenes TaxID=67255 RepID=A0ABU0PU57_STRAH|nr:hypothetical protein [Streptomyces achromogenes]MDQ0828294.1 hypothetical protein [Streptomyces achromogenes]
MRSLYCLRPYPTPQEPAIATQCDPTVPAGWSR